MRENAFEPYVRFINRRSLIESYPARIYAFDYRLFYAVRGSFDVEYGEERIKMAPSSLLIIPPAEGYRLISLDEQAEFYIINFDFDSSNIGSSTRHPVGKERFDKSKVFSHYSIPPFEKLFHLSGVYEFESILREMDIQSEMDAFTINNIQSGLMKYLLTKAAHLYYTRQKGREDDLIQRVKAYVEQNYSAAINNSLVAREIGYHPHYLNSQFLKSTGITLHGYIESVRIKYAKELLANTKKPVYEVAWSCGFSDTSYFVKFFFRHTGMTPKHYRALCM